MSSGSELNDRSRDSEASGPIATSPGSRHSQVASNSRSQMSPGADLSGRVASAAEVCRTTTMKGVVNKDCDLEIDTLADGKPVELIPQHRSDMVTDKPPRYQSLNHLGDESEVGDRPVILHVRRIEMC